MALPFVAKVPWLNTYAPSHVSSLIFFFFKLFKKTLLLQGQRCVLSRKFKPGTFLNIFMVFVTYFVLLRKTTI